MENKNQVMVLEGDIVEKLSPAVRSDLESNFTPLFNQAQEWKEKAKTLKVTDASQTDLMKQAREARLALKNIRVEAEKVKTKLKEESLLKGKAIDGMYNIIKFLVQPIEKELEEQEKFVELQEEKRLNELTESRIAELSKYVDDVSIYNVRIMSEEAYQGLLDSSKKIHAMKLEEQRKAEEARIAKEKEEAEERERIRLENERLKKENERKDSRFKALYGAGLRHTGEDQLEYGEITVTYKEIVEDTDEIFDKKVAKITKEVATLKAAEEKARKDAEEAEAKAKAEREAKERKEREEYEAKIKAEREEKLRLEKELQSKKEAEEKAEAERLEAERKLKAAPDKEKLQAFAAQMLAVEVPEMESEDGKRIAEAVRGYLKKLNVFLADNITKF